MTWTTEEFNRSGKPDASPDGAGGDKVYGRAPVPRRDAAVAAAPAAPVTPTTPPADDEGDGGSDGSVGGSVGGEASGAVPVRPDPPSPPQPVDDRDGDEDDEPPAVRPRRGLWRTAVIAFVTVAVFAGAGVGYSLLQPTVFGAQADFILTPRPELSDAAVDRAMVTQTLVIRSDTVLAPVANQVGMPLSRLRDDVSADIVGRSNILRLTVGSRDQARAVTLAQLITAEYLRASGAAAGSAPDDRGVMITPTLLAGAAPLDSPLQPRPLRALVAGILLGVLVAAAVVTVLLRPRFLARPSPHWE